MQTPDERIAALAYERFLARGCEHGHDVEDWFAAEAELAREVYEVVLVEPGPNTIELLRTLREVSGRGLAELRIAIETTPFVLLRGTLGDAHRVRAAVESLAGRIELRPA